MAPRRNNATLALVRTGTGRDPEELLRELYVEKRLADQAIADALTAKLDHAISRRLVAQWRTQFGITRDDRPAVSL